MFWGRPAATITAASAQIVLVGSANSDLGVMFGVVSGTATDETISMVQVVGGSPVLQYARSNVAADWVHVAFVWDAGASKYRIYLNGTLVSGYAGTLGTPALQSGQQFYFGRRATQYGTITMADVRVYSDPPTAAEVLAIVQGRG
jgi:hypothetical protein